MFKILGRLQLKQWLLIAISLVFIVFQVWLDLKLPDYMNEITVIIKSGNGSIKDIWVNGGYMLLCALGSMLAAILVGFIMARIAASFSEYLRFKMFKKIDSFSQNEINNFSTSSLLNRTTNDVTQVQMFITMGAQLLLKAPILAVWAVIKIAGKGFEWSMATAVTIGLITIVILFIMIFVVPKFKKIQTKIDDLTKETRESLTGVRVVRAYNAEKHQEAKFNEANQSLTDINLFTNRGMSVMMPTMNFLMSTLSLSIFWIAAILINNLAVSDISERLTMFGNMAVFSQYAMQVIMAYMMLVMIFILLPRTIVSARRINEVLDTKSSIIGGSITENDENLSGEIEFKNVSFKYPGAAEYILNDINLKIKQGETVAFIGSTGSGKSTLINLVPRFYDATEGEILINNINIKDYDLNFLHNKIGYVPQRAVLFKGTIEENVNFGDNGKEPSTEEEIWKALEIAQGKDFVENEKNQLLSEVSQAGTNLSGGQKQRLAIARAVARKPEIYIFDDSFSALDYRTDRKLRTALRKETAGVTNLIVAQRIGTIMDADQIVVLENGKIVGKGKHQELLKNCSVYKEIAMSQLSEEELA